MTKKDIVRKLVRMLEKYPRNPFRIKKLRFTKDMYADFEYSHGDLIFRLNLIFVAHNYCKVIAHLSLFSGTVNSLLDKISDYTENSFELASVSINTYLSDGNRLGIVNNQADVELYLDKAPVNNMDDIEKIFSEIFLHQILETILNTLIPQMDSLEKLDYLFNTLPFEENDGDSPRLTVYQRFLPEQILSGTLLALAVRKTELETLFKKYHNYSCKFEEGRKFSMDVIRKVTQQ